MGCLKVHGTLAHVSMAERVIGTSRDPRDILVSFMRFMHCDFDYALPIVVESTAICDNYRTLPPEILLCLDYNMIDTQPVEATTKISAFLQLDLAAHRIATIAEQYSRANVRLILDHLQSDIDREREECRPL